MDTDISVQHVGTGMGRVERDGRGEDKGEEGKDRMLDCECGEAEAAANPRAPPSVRWVHGCGGLPNRWRMRQALPKPSSATSPRSSSGVHG